MLLERPADVAIPTPVQDLVAEANHRIANTLLLISSLLRQQSAELGDDTRLITVASAREVLARTSGRIDAAGRLHRMLCAEGTHGGIEIGGYLHQLVSELVRSLSSREKLSLRSVCEMGARLAPERALRLGLLVNEWVVNAIKHAHPAKVAGHIDLRCQGIAGLLIVEVTDDGVGFPDDFDPDDDRYTGLRLVRALAQQIGAKLEFSSGSLGLACRATLRIDD